MKKHCTYLWILLLLAACSGNQKKVKNDFYGELTETKRLMESGEKRFRLDTETKAKLSYIQLFTDDMGNRLLTFLNSRKNSIYFYDYSDTTYIKQLVFEREGTNAVTSVGAYCIKTPDSIYVFNRQGIEIALTDSIG